MGVSYLWSETISFSVVFVIVNVSTLVEDFRFTTGTYPLILVECFCLVKAYASWGAVVPCIAAVTLDPKDRSGFCVCLTADAAKPWVVIVIPLGFLI